MTGRHARPGAHAAIGAHAAPDTLAADIRQWEADVSAHAHEGATFNAAEHETIEIIEHCSAQLLRAGELLGRARNLFLRGQQ